jgi:NAD(P)-dependent dehydrogenase (short-subunit alcohol dehydrogenase family)
MSVTTKGQRKRPAVITGVGSGLGRDIALGLAAKGCLLAGGRHLGRQFQMSRAEAEGVLTAVLQSVNNGAGGRARPVPS